MMLNKIATKFPSGTSVKGHRDMKPAACVEGKLVAVGIRSPDAKA